MGRAAYYIVNEVRYQFANVKGIWEGTVDPDYGKIVSICTGAAQKELLTPALLAIISPMVVAVAGGGYQERGLTPVTITIVIAGLIAIGIAVWFSKKAGAFGQ